LRFGRRNYLLNRFKKTLHFPQIGLYFLHHISAALMIPQNFPQINEIFLQIIPELEQIEQKDEPRRSKDYPRQVKHLPRRSKDSPRE
jgi:hypothetical protein